MHQTFGRVLVSLALALAVSACGGGGGGGDGGDDTPATTALQVEAVISRFDRADGYTEIYWDVSVRRDDVPANDAVATVNGVLLPRGSGFIDGWYTLTEYSTPPASYVPGQSYTIVVTQGGQTVTDTMTAPGGYTVTSDGLGVAWATNGTNASIDVRHLFGSTTWYAPATSPAFLASPQTIPVSAYPPGDTYELVAVVQNTKSDRFGTLSGDRSHYLIEDGVERRFVK